MTTKAQRRALRDDDPIVGVGGVVYRCGEHGGIEVLLIRKRDGYWTLPKGKVKAGEPEPAALMREVAEETGIAGEVEAPLRTVSYVTPRRKPPRRKVVTYYLLRAVDGRLHPSHAEGIVDLRWVSLSGSIERVHRKRVRRVVRDAAALLGAAPAPCAGEGEPA